MRRATELAANLRESVWLPRKPPSILEAACAALHAVGDEIGPDELDDARVVVAIRKVVVQGRKAVPLARLFHGRELLRVETVAFDVAPIIRRGVHRKARSDGSIRAHNHVVLSRPAVPARRFAISPFVPEPSPFQPSFFKSAPLAMRMKAFIS